MREEEREGKREKRRKRKSESWGRERACKRDQNEKDKRGRELAKERKR